MAKIFGQKDFQVLYEGKMTSKKRSQLLKNIGKLCTPTVDIHMNINLCSTVKQRFAFFVILYLTINYVLATYLYLIEPRFVIFYKF